MHVAACMFEERSAFQTFQQLVRCIIVYPQICVTEGFFSRKFNLLLLDLTERTQLQLRHHTPGCDE